MPDLIEPSRARREEFVNAQKEAWTSVSRLLGMVRAAYVAEVGDAGLAAAQSFGEAVQLYERKGRALLVNALEGFERARPIRHSLNAIENYDRESGDSAILDSVRRARIDGAMQVLLGKSLLSLNTPWLIWIGGREAREGAARWAKWCEGVERHESDAAAVLTRYEAWAAEATGERRATPETKRKKHERHLAFWWRRQRSVAANLELAGGVWRSGLDLLHLAGAMSQRIEEEREDLLRALREQIRYLENWGGGIFDPPAIEARIVTKEERREEWWSRCNAILESHLPQSLECFAPPMVLPTVFDRPRRLAPRRVFQDALREAAREIFQRQFGAVMESHLAIALEIERAGEVIRYASEASKAAEGDLLPEAVRNVIERLRERAESERALRLQLDAAIIPVVARATREAGESAGKKASSAVALHMRRKSAALLREGRAGATDRAGSLEARISQSIVEAYDEFLISIGWRTPVRIPVAPVIARPDLGDALKLDIGHRDLPALYLRLFRLAPVDDPRFLVGREEELNGFRQALADWSSGCYAACMAVGARGSGKTSLLNCAIPAVFAKQHVIRGQFNNRISSPADLEGFLQTLLGLSGEDELEAALASTRRVVVLEEVERVFLKTFGGFSAARRLLELVQASAPTTLWVLVLNLHAGRLLHEAVRWNSYFSHTINSMSVWPADLTRAVLQRHNLSGLKLAFAEPPVNLLRQRFGIKVDAQEAFFDTLYEQSGGNFRSAFELWQSSVERVEGGTIQMRQPLAPDLGPLRNELRQEDHFTLLSVLQHGSLTVAELATVLREPERASRMRLERLTAMGIIEQDPEHPGQRVRAEAQRFVHTALQSVNLI